MFSKKDINNLDREYFDILGSSPFAITLKSKNTSHEWHILYTVGLNWKSCKVYHRHHHDDAWHWHGSKPTLAASIEDIKDHDRYQLEKDSKR